MNERTERNASAPGTSHPVRSSAGYPEQTTSVAGMLRDHLMESARARSIRKVVVGGRFCAVVLDDGWAGAVNICPDVCGEPSVTMSDGLLPPGTSAADALANLVRPARSAMGLATANALANRPIHLLGTSCEQRSGGDLLDVLELNPDDHVGMVGCFSPMLDRIRRRVGRLSIFERPPRLRPGLYPEQRAYEMLPTCSVALITATTIVNGTVDGLLAASAGCREVVLLGPSTPLVAELFVSAPRRATLLAGVLITKPDELLDIVARGGGTRDFEAGVTKVNIRVDAVDKDPCRLSQGETGARPRNARSAHKTPGVPARGRSHRTGR